MVMSNLRILHVFKTYYPDSYGGVEQTIKQICLGTSKLGMTNRILTLSRTPVLRVLAKPEAEIYQFPLNFEIASTGFSIQALKGYQKLSQWADVVHYHFPWPFADLLHFSSLKKRKSIVTYHSDIIRQKVFLPLYRPLMHKFLSSVDRIIATSPNYLASSELLQEFQHKTRIIPIGLDESTYPIALPENIQKWQKKFGTDFFLFVGVLRYYKGLHILLEAIQGTPFHVVIIGSGPTEFELKAHAAQLKLNNVHFLGKLADEDKVAFFQLCRAVIFPSHLRSEAFGISLLEGAMYNKPLISCELGTGSSYINLDKVTGLVVPPNNPQALRLAMEYFSLNEADRIQMGKNANVRFCELFRAETMSKEYAKIYQEVSAL